MSFLAALHIALLHDRGSNNPLGVVSGPEKIPFHPYFTSKDALAILVALSAFLCFILALPNALGDPENFNPARTINTPLHIQPE